MAGRTRPSRPSIPAISAPERSVVAAQPAMLPSVESAHVEAEAKPSWLARIRRAYVKASGGSMLLSIGIHAVILIVGAYLVVSQITEERKISFGGGEPGPKSEIQHKVKRKTSTAPAPNKRITTTSSIAKVALPDMPTLPNNMGLSIAGAIGSGGFGTASGLGGGGKGGGGKGNFSKITFFGLNTGGKGAGLQGTFYDFKMTQGKQPTKLGRGREVFTKMCQGFKRPLNFQNDPLPHYTSPTKLFSKFICFPGIMGVEAGPAFSSKDSKEGYWVAVYSGKFKANVPGRHRFVGTGDNLCAVKVDGVIVLDASDWGVYGEKREGVGAATLGKNPASAVYAGKWINLDHTEKTIDIVVGDEGGVFCAFVMIQREGKKIELDKNGIPKLPLFITGELSDSEKALLKDLPPEALQGPIFPLTSSSGLLLPR